MSWCASRSGSISSGCPEPRCALSCVGAYCPARAPDGCAYAVSSRHIAYSDHGSDSLPTAGGAQLADLLLECSLRRSIQLELIHLGRVERCFLAFPLQIGERIVRALAVRIEHDGCGYVAVGLRQATQPDEANGGLQYKAPIRSCRGCLTSARQRCHSNALCRSRAAQSDGDLRHEIAPALHPTCPPRGLHEQSVERWPHSLSEAPCCAPAGGLTFDLLPLMPQRYRRGHEALGLKPRRTSRPTSASVAFMVKSTTSASLATLVSTFITPRRVNRTCVRTPRSITVSVCACSGTASRWSTSRRSRRPSRA